MTVSIEGSHSGTLDVARLIVNRGHVSGTVTARSVDGSGTFEDLVALELLEARGSNYDHFRAAHITLGNATSTAVYRRRLDRPLVTYSGTMTLTSATLEVAIGSYRIHERQWITVTRGATPVSGTFAGLPEGAEVTAGEHVYRIRYDVLYGNEHEVRLEWLRNTNTRT